MTQREMRAMLLRTSGIGVKVTPVTGVPTFLFFEDLENDNGVERAKRRFCRGEKLSFYSTLWAQQSQFKEYMAHYKLLRKRTWEIPEDYVVEEAKHYKEFLIKQLMNWTDCSYAFAKLQVSQKIIMYSNFKGRVAA